MLTYGAALIGIILLASALTLLVCVIFGNGAYVFFPIIIIIIVMEILFNGASLYDICLVIFIALATKGIYDKFKKYKK